MFDGGGVTSAQRPFTSANGSSALQVGQKIVVDLENGGVANGHSEGFTLWNASGNLVWEMHYVGGDAWYIVDNAGTVKNANIPYAGSGCRVSFTLTSSTTYSFTVQVAIGGTTYGPYTGTLASPTGGSAITQLRFYTSAIGSGNNLQVGQIGVGWPSDMAGRDLADRSGGVLGCYGNFRPYQRDG